MCVTTTDVTVHAKIFHAVEKQKYFPLTQAKWRGMGLTLNVLLLKVGIWIIRGSRRLDLKYGNHMIMRRYGWIAIKYLCNVTFDKNTFSHKIHFWMDNISFHATNKTRRESMVSSESSLDSTWISFYFPFFLSVILSLSFSCRTFCWFAKLGCKKLQIIFILVRI